MYNGLQSGSMKGSGLSGFVERSRVQVATASRPAAAGPVGRPTVNPLEEGRSQRENAALAARLDLHRRRRDAVLRAALYRESRLAERPDIEPAVLEAEVEGTRRAVLDRVEAEEQQAAAAARRKSAAAFAEAFDVKPREVGDAWDYARLQREKMAAEEERRARAEEKVSERIKRLRTESDL